jgi:hypothetical protein
MSKSGLTDKAVKKIRFAIYLVKSSGWAEERPLNELTLDEKPILTEQDIASYQVESHSIWLKPGVKVQVPPITAKMHQFVVVADGARIYLGDFWPSVSNLIPKQPFVELPRGDETTEFKIVISIVGSPNDPRIVKVFRGIGKLNANRVSHISDK